MAFLLLALNFRARIAEEMLLPVLSRSAARQDGRALSNQASAFSRDVSRSAAEYDFYESPMDASLCS